ncbi:MULTISPECIES: hypothetical protein [Sphingobacterium]|uniref:hypothetical protein n=1 Tax=Sphingobacterium TaxID=28453 RepID=UPI0013DB8574|nr:MULTISPECIES: hypothetical protein [unclassified Sphingobacterium]
MIGFVKLRISILQELKAMGFNILRSSSQTDDLNPNWIPGRVSQEVLYSGSSKVLLIDQVLRSHSDRDLTGQVFYVYAEEISS